MRGKFIVFEGADGSGLSTQSKLLYEYLKRHGRSAIHTKEPTNGYIGKVIRRALRRKMHFSLETLQLLFCADRADHVESVIKPALKHGKTVICDRYVMSTVAYGALKLDRRWLLGINSRFIMPDVTVLLDVPASVCIKRIKKRGASELFEEKERLKKIRANYMSLRKNFRKVLVVDGNRPIAEVFEDVRRKSGY